MACKFKLCGMRTPEDIAVANACGAWAVGFVLTESVRRIPLETCKILCESVLQGIMKVGVFTEESPEEIRNAVEFCRLDFAQVPGERTGELRDSLKNITLLPAFRIRDEESLNLLDVVRGERFLLDSFVPGMAGGSGKTFDWSLAKKADGYGQVILAGGLTPENVEDAIRVAEPWAVDVSSGIEREKGVKDHARMRAFAKAVQAANADLEPKKKRD